MGFKVSVSLHPAIQATGRLTFAPAGLIPAEHTSLHWTHKRSQSNERVPIWQNEAKRIGAETLIGQKKGAQVHPNPFSSTRLYGDAVSPICRPGRWGMRKIEMMISTARTAEAFRSPTPRPP